MESADFSPKALFDLEGFEHAALFDGVANAWEVLGAPLRSYLEARVQPRSEGTVHPGAWVEGRVEIGAGTVIEPGAFVQGPCILGRGVKVRHGAYVRGDALIGDEAVVGHATEVKGSIFLPGAKAGHFAYVGDSILGRDVNLGAGTKLANLRLDGAEVEIRVEDRVFRTGLRKLGAILGDGAQTGCNAVTNPGTVLGRGALVHPCRAVSGWRGPGSTSK